jgi:hypothetical protein
MLFEPVFGEDNEIIGYLDQDHNWWTIVDAEEYWNVSGNSLEDSMHEFVQTWVGW